MKSHKIALKLYVEGGSLPAHARFVEVFHDWIKDNVLDETMIDVVDYGHVHQGPIVLFVGHESDYAIDLGEGRAGLLYVRKRVSNDDPSSNLDDALKRILAVAERLEKDPRLVGLAFGRREVLLRVLDRLRAPNVDGTFVEERAGIEAAFERALGKVAVTREGSDAREPFTVRARVSS
ncbi:MAG: hypothetical protein HOW73_37280 [Polyangiaceae bacterium]|nr:hypothetical protein [Polyangiaceae bacterium]